MWLNEVVFQIFSWATKVSSFISLLVLNVYSNQCSDGDSDHSLGQNFHQPFHQLAADERASLKPIGEKALKIRVAH